MEPMLAAKAIAAFILVLGLMYLLPFAIKKIGLHGPSMLQPGKRRLKLVEYLPLDAKRRLVLIRRDQKEFLLVLGPNGETIVESNIPAATDNIIDLPAQKEQKNG